MAAFANVTFTTNNPPPPKKKIPPKNPGKMCLGKYAIGRPVLCSKFSFKAKKWESVVILQHT